MYTNSTRLSNCALTPLNKGRLLTVSGALAQSTSPIWSYFRGVSIDFRARLGYTACLLAGPGLLSRTASIPYGRFVDEQRSQFSI